MQRTQGTLPLLALFSFLFACGGGGGLGGSDALNADECRLLLVQIEKLTLASLSPEERDLAASTPDELEEDVKECIERPAWDRKGFECAMRATTETALKRCILAG